MQTRAKSAGNHGGLNWPLITGFWLLIAAILLGRALLQFGTVPLLGDADDAMRIVTATDLLHGQAWTDLVQHRDNTPYGIGMHWSRLIDAPIALLIWLAEPFFGAGARNAAAMIWPLLLLLPLMALSAAVTRRLVPEAEVFTAIVLPVVSLVILIEFLPGRPDHHNVQILLSLLTLLGLLAWRTHWAGAMLTGLVAATSLAIGMETLLFAVVACGAYAMFWLFEPQRYRVPLVVFAISLAGGSLAHFLLATGAANYFVEACDMLTITYVVAIGIGAAALVLTALVASPMPKLWQRFALLAGLGALTLLAVALLYPECLRGPYAVIDPRVMAYYLSDIPEAQSLWTRLLADPPTAIAFASATLIALPLTAWRAWVERGEHRANWLLILAFLAGASLIMLVQIRGARIAAPFAIPAAAWLITEARRRYLEKAGPRSAAALLGAWLLFAGTAHFALVAGIGLALSPGVVRAAGGNSDNPRQTCFLESAFAHLGELPPGRVIAPVVFGSNILRFTGHSVVSAGFHRNNAGNLDVAAFFAGDEAVAKRIAEERGLDYVVTCPGAPAYEGKIGPDRASTWTWLTPLSAPEERLHIFRIER